MSEEPRMRPGNIAQNLGNILQAQKEATKETVTAEEVREKLETAKAQEAPAQEKKFVFKGFVHKSEPAAKAETHLPVTNVAVRQSSIVYKEEVNLAQTIIKEEDLFTEMLKLLYSHLVEGPSEIMGSFENFLNNIAEQDVEALLYGFYLTSYGPDVNLDETYTCAECGGKHEVKKINLIELYKEKSFEGSPYQALNEEKSIDLNDCDLPNTVFYFKFPTLTRAINAKNVTKNNFLNEIANSSIANFMSRFATLDESGTPVEYADAESIKSAIDTLNVKARKKIKKFLQENFFEYGLKFEYAWTCNNMVPDKDAISENAKKKCMHNNTHKYSINNLFFREISQSVS